MPTANTLIVTPGPKPCNPFSLQVMVYSPETGYKFQVSIERDCTPDNQSVWKLIFDLYKRPAAGQDFDQLAHVSYTATTPATQTGVQGMVENGVTPAQADVLTNQVYPAAKTVVGAKPTDADKTALHDSITQAVTTVDV